MKNKPFSATYVIEVEGSGEGGYHVLVTSQMVRDKITSFLQELFMLQHLDGFSVLEVKPQNIKNIKSKFEKFERKADEKGKRTRKYS